MTLTLILCAYIQHHWEIELLLNGVLAGLVLMAYADMPNGLKGPMTIRV